MKNYSRHVGLFFIFSLVFRFCLENSDVRSPERHRWSSLSPVNPVKSTGLVVQSQHKPSVINKQGPQRTTYLSAKTHKHLGGEAPVRRRCRNHLPQCLLCLLVGTLSHVALATPCAPCTGLLMEDLRLSWKHPEVFFRSPVITIR
jgi:hypothetical protein